MPLDERESPRAAIRSWLHGAEIKSPKPRQIHADVRREQHQHGGRARHYSPGQGVRRKEIELQRAAKYRIQHINRCEDPNARNHGDDMEDLEHGAVRGATLKSKKAQTHGHTKRHTIQRPNEPGLAEKLGLHAPFRTFRDRSEEEDVDLDALSRPRKRRRRRSSTGSYLEPAEVQEPIDLERCAGRSVKEAKNGVGRRRHPGSLPEHLSESSVATAPIQEKPTKSYVRRLRHKTRDDRYELKEGHDARKKKTKLNKEEGEDKKYKKHKRKAKMGAAIMDDFSAQNVSHNRLTLQPAKSLGLFGKGRASSPVRRRGLPDLAFSEISFLNSRRPKPTEIAAPSDTWPAEKRKRQKSTQVADTEAEISRYFISKKAPDQHLSDRPYEPKQRDSHKRFRNRHSPPDFVDLPGTPFLGFGSCGAASVSPAKRLGSPALRELERRLTRSPTRLTSYLTWSQSGAPSQGSLRPEKHKVLPMESSRGLIPVSRGTDPSRLALSSSYDEKNLIEKHRTGVSVTPEQIPRSRSGHCQGRLPQPEARYNGGIEQTNQDQDIQNIGQHLGHNTLRSVENTSQRIQAHRSPHLSHGNAASPPVSGMLADRDEPKAKATTIPRPSDIGVEDNINPLDTALEALLHDARPTDREVRNVAIGTTASVLKHTNHDQVSPVNRTHHDPRNSSFDHGGLPLAGRNRESKNPISADGPHKRYDMPYSKHSTLGPSSHPSSRSKCGDYTPELPQSPRGRRVDSRSAWNGYGDIYERQRLELPPAIDHHYYSADHNVVNDGDYGMRDGPLPPSRQHPAGYCDDHIGSAFHERHGMLLPANSRIEEEPYLDDGAWGDVEGNISADHDDASPAERLAHIFVDRYQGYDTFQEPQYRTKPGIVTRRPAILPSMPVMEKLAPSGFWTPHKLY